MLCCYCPGLDWRGLLKAPRHSHRLVGRAAGQKRCLSRPLRTWGWVLRPNELRQSGTPTPWNYPPHTQSAGQPWSL